MSEHKKEAKASSAAKLQRMGLKLDDGSKSFTDERGGSPFEGLNSGNAGKMPITPSRFKRGGKVSKHANLEGEKTKHNLGKAPRKAAGGPLPHPGQRREPVPLPPRRSVADEYEAYNPNEDTDLGSKGFSYARGGLSSMNPAKRKAAIGAMVARKNKMGVPSAPPPSRGILPASVRPMLSPVPTMGRKRGGKAEHPDVAEDKKLVKQMVKPSALKHRAHKTGGGSLDSLEGEYDDHRGAFGKGNHMLALSRMKAKLQPYRTPDEERERNLNYFSKSPVTKNLVERYKEKYADQDKNASLTSSGLKRGGMAYRSKKFDGGGITGMNPMMQRPGTTQPNMMLRPPMGQGPGMGQSAMGQGPFNPMGNRPMRASGGRTKTGKTNVNIIISPQSGQGQAPLGAGVEMGQPPVPPMMPPMGGMPPMPPGGAMPPMMPPGGAPAGLPPQLMAALAAKGGAGGPPPMARKSGGRVGNVMPKYQEKDYGSGSGLGRLEKKKWPTANGTE